MADTAAATQQVTTAQDNNNTGAPKVPFSLDVLHICKTSQFLHGLRHGDYARYRQYCTRRVRRIRKALKFVHGKNKYQKKVIESALVTDSRYLLLVLVYAERSWSYAMHLKDEAANSARARIHMHRKLAKAVKYAKHFEQLCNEKADQRTILEATVYAIGMEGNYLLEKEKWGEALAHFLKAKSIYEQLGKVGDSDYQELCKQKVEELEPSIRYCNYNLNKSGKAKDTKDLTELRMESKGANVDLLQSKLDAVIAESLKQQSSALREIAWKGKKVPIKNEKLRTTILSAQEIDYELGKADSFEGKMAIYDKSFVSYNDALNIIRDEFSTLSSGKNKSSKTEAQQEQLNLLKSYVSYLKLNKTIERNLLMADSLEKRLVGKTSESGSAATEDGPKKRAKPNDLVKVYETIIGNMTELAEITGSDNKEQTKENVARLSSFKAMRCYYMALSYLEASKWAEALALLDRAADQINNAKKYQHDSKNIPKEEIARLEQIESSIRGNRCEVHAKAFLEAVKAKTQATQDDNNNNNNNAPAAQPENAPKPTLLTKINDFDYNLNAKDRALIEFPPDFEAVKCKPLLFDLALGGCEFPNLEARKTAKPTTTGGWLSSFWRSS